MVEAAMNVWMMYEGVREWKRGKEEREKGMEGKQEWGNATGMREIGGPVCALGCPLAGDPAADIACGLDEPINVERAPHGNSRGKSLSSHERR